LASLKIAWDGKGKSSHVQCYSPDSFKHGFLNLFTIISFHNASLPRLCTHMHVPYSFFSLVLSLSSLVYIPPLASSFTDELTVSVHASSHVGSSRENAITTGWLI